MSVDSEDVRRADARAAAARQRFQGALMFAKNRASPSRIKSDVVEGTKARLADVQHGTTETIKRHPVAVSSFAAAVAAFLFRKPLAALAGRGWGSTREFRHRLKRKEWL